MLAFFIISSGIIVMNEAARLIPKIHFPFSKAACFFLREKEQQNFASYLYFSIGMIFSSLILTTLPILAILATLSFGDSSYALIGKRFGKHKIPFNKIKSIEGSIGGFFVTFICTLPLVGLIYGLVAAILFTLIDIITPRMPMCDNIMGPVLITLGFWIMGSFGLKIGGLIVLLI
jgi:dolichol kinase